MIFAIGTAVLVGMIACSGWQFLSNRAIPPLVQSGNMSELRGFVRACDLSVLATALVLAAGLVALGYFSQNLRSELLLSAVLTVPMAFVVLRRQQLASVHRAGTGMVLDQAFASLVALIVMLAVRITVIQTVLIYGAALVVSVVVATKIFHAGLPPTWRLGNPRYKVRLWLSMAVPMFLGLVAQLLNSRMDVILVAPMSGLFQAGLYGAAFRLTALITFPQFVMSTVTTPEFSVAFSAGDIGRVRLVLKRSLIFGLVTCVPVALPIVVFPDRMIDLVFGPKFIGAGEVLRMLTLGQLAFGFAIPLSAILMMGDEERKFGTISVAVLLLNLVASVILIPSMLALGAAIASMLSGLIFLAWHSVAVISLINRRTQINKHLSY